MPCGCSLFLHILCGMRSSLQFIQIQKQLVLNLSFAVYHLSDPTISKPEFFHVKNGDRNNNRHSSECEKSPFREWASGSQKKDPFSKIYPLLQDPSPVSSELPSFCGLRRALLAQLCPVPKVPGPQLPTAELGKQAKTYE